MDTDAVKEDVGKKVDELAGELWDLSMTIHANPETLFEEHRAAAAIAGFLRSHGFDVTLPEAGLETAFKAVSNKGAKGPRVSFIAEYDALPDIGHACGHNLITGASVGAAVALSRTGYEGEIWVHGTPAEEGGGGKIKMIGKGSFDGIDIAMMMHPFNRTRLGDMLLAIDELKVTFKGRAAHASAEPEKGINALDAVISVFNGISALRQHVTPDVRMHGIITDGGAKPNIVPERAAAHFFLRAMTDENLANTEERVRGIIEGAEKATGAKADVEIVKGYRSRKMARNAIESFGRNLEALGLATEWAPPGTFTGSSDVGDLSHVVPLVHEFVAICGPDEAACHSRPFADAAASERGRKAMLDSAKALAMTAVDVYYDKDLLSEIMKEFKRP